MLYIEEENKMLYYEPPSVGDRIVCWLSVLAIPLLILFACGICTKLIGISFIAILIVQVFTLWADVLFNEQ